jgi:hypothetical protein
MFTDIVQKTRKERINMLVHILEKEHPDMLDKELQRLYLDSIIKKLDGSVKENTLTMDEIVEEVNIVRQEMYEKKNRI